MLAGEVVLSCLRTRGPDPSPARPRWSDSSAAKTRVRIDKARRLLGYEPAFALNGGMELTEQWARWANLL